MIGGRIPDPRRGDGPVPRIVVRLELAVGWFEKVLQLDPENVVAHYNLGLIQGLLGDHDAAERHRSLHATYKPDDNARDRAVAAARIGYPAANHAAEAVVIYDLQRDGAYELPAVQVVHND